MTSHVRRPWTCGLLLLFALVGEAGATIQASCPGVGPYCPVDLDTLAPTSISTSCSNPAVTVTEIARVKVTGTTVDCSGQAISLYDMTWRLTDTCSNQVDLTCRVQVDDVGPVLSGVPTEPVRCGCADPLTFCEETVTITAADGCSEPVDIDTVLTSTAWDPAGCGNVRVETWTTTATDACGNETVAVWYKDVSDTVGPHPVCAWNPFPDCQPPDITTDCDVPPTEPPLLVFGDTCSSSTWSYGETTVAGPCGGSYDIIRAWTAVDCTGNETVIDQIVHVIDSYPPVVTASSGVVGCLWPPHHDYHCFDLDDFEVEVTDEGCTGPNTIGITVTIVDCVSSQPIDANGVGDGTTSDDCVVASDGLSVCVRAERDGVDPAGRDYTIIAQAVDDCGNVSDEETVGVIHVPHDMSNPDERDCRTGGTP